MIYRSTRGGEERLTAAQAVIRGISENGGLFVPLEMPKLKVSIDEIKDMNYQQVAKMVIGEFFDDYTDEEIDYCVDSAYKFGEKFEKEEIVPVVKVGDCNFIELYHGRTAAFKDMALSILPYLLRTAVKKQNEDKKICILTATSGDTGKAALEGFANVENTEIMVFFPEDGVSQVQRQQMVTQTGDNTEVFAIKGNFDDAQTGVKKIFGDREFAKEIEKKGYRFSSANSINIGRLIPQVAYYVYSYGQLVKTGRIKNGEEINVTVPTGNFGNILAAYYAKQMGIPINRFICASNRNKVLTDFIRTGNYDINREFHLTESPSMDILISSNLERLLYHLSGEDTELISQYMKSLEDNKAYSVDKEIKNGLEEFYGGFADEEETKETIRNLYNEKHYLVDTHTAVAYKVYKDYVEETGDKRVTLIASTASPYKFAESVLDSIGLPKEENGFKAIKALNKETGVKIPEGLKELDKKEVLHDEVIAKEDMKKAVISKL